MRADDEVIEDVDESDNPPEDIVYTINNFGADFLVDGLVRRLDSGDIYRPDFQRKFVWSHHQASRFIESILLGLPIPGVFLYREEETRKHLIIDGLQRLTTLAAFAKGKLPLTEDDFVLDGLKSRFNGKTISTLSVEDNRRFMDTAIHATIIQQLTPEKDNSSAYYIFERLNTGGTPLQPQEIRAALYHGPFQDFLQDLNRDAQWRRIFGKEHLRAKDQELILRFIAFRFSRNTYSAPLKGFLSDFMREYRKLPEQKAILFRKEFTSALDFIVSNVGPRAFRPVRSLNAAAFDSIMVAVAENLKTLQRNATAFKSRYEKLMRDENYIKLITRSTADEQSVIYRFDIARNTLLGK